MSDRASDSAGLKIGILGAGQFSGTFVPLFQNHPHVAEVAVADLVPERAQDFATRYELKRIFQDLDEMCASDLDAIAIFTQRWLHAPQAIQALQAGKHVYSAVPTGITEAELRGLVQAVQDSGRTYMVDVPLDWVSWRVLELAPPEKSP